METLRFCPRPDYTVTQEPNLNTVEFGDGYKQSRPKGLNHMLAKFSVVFKLKKAETAELDQFMMRHGGYLPFYFNDDGTLRKVKCTKWVTTKGQIYKETTCDFEEVV